MFNFFFTENLNLKGYLNRFIGPQVTAILVNGGILPSVGVASGRVCPAACAAGLLKQGKPFPWHLYVNLDDFKVDLNQMYN